MANYAYAEGTGQDMSGPLALRPLSAPPGSRYDTTDSNGSYLYDSLLGWIRTVAAAYPPSGSAGGDLTGTYPNPTLALNRVKVAGDTMTGDLQFAEGATASIGTSDVNAFRVKTNGTVRLTWDSGDAGFFAGTSATVPGALKYVPNGTYLSWFGVYNDVTAIYYGIGTGLPGPAGTSLLAGYYSGLGIGGASANLGNAIFGVLNSGQSGNGNNSVAFTVYDNNVIQTFKNILDDGSGTMTVTGQLVTKGDIVTSDAITGIAPLTMDRGETSSTFSVAGIALTYSTTNNYAHWIHWRHNGGATANNAIDFYTSDGTAAGTYPTNAVHGLTINGGLVGGHGITGPTAGFHAPASTTSAASLRLPAGTAPTSPNDGDIWYDGANIKIRVGVTTKTFTIA